MTEVILFPGALAREADSVRVRLDVNEWWVETMLGPRILSRERQSTEADARRRAARYSAERGLAYLPIASTNAGATDPF